METMRSNEQARVEGKEFSLTFIGNLYKDAESARSEVIFVSSVYWWEGCLIIDRKDEKLWAGKLQTLQSRVPRPIKESLLVSSGFEGPINSSDEGAIVDFMALRFLRQGERSLSINQTSLSHAELENLRLSGLMLDQNGQANLALKA